MSLGINLGDDDLVLGVSERIGEELVDLLHLPLSGDASSRLQ
jgi:hypothetical protein